MRAIALHKSTLRRGVAALLLASVCIASAQGPAPANRANWKLANRFTSDSLRPFVYSTSLTPNFINKTDTFWYSWKDSNGVKFWKVDPKAKTKAPLFDSAKMAALLSEALKRPYDTTNLPITSITFDERQDHIFRFVVENTEFEYNTRSEQLREVRKIGQQGGANRGPGGGFTGANFRNYSPDRSAFVYAMDHNLYYVPVEKVKGTDGKETEKEGTPVQLTKDGEKDYSFGSREEQDRFQQMFQQQQEGQTQGQNRERRVRANVVWSKDSKRFYVTRSDSRKVKELFLVNSLTTPRPSLLTYKYEMPGEPDVTQIELNIFEPEKKEVRKLPIDKWKDQRIFNIHFQDGTSDKLRFVRRDRLQRNLELAEIDLKSNDINVLLTEKVENAFLETQQVRYVKPNGDFVWFSERNGWGHYYLYSNDGKLKNAITSGAFRAHSIEDVDDKNGFLYFQGVGREANENPYYRHLYRVSLDGKNLTLLDPEHADHNSFLSTSKKYIVDVMSRTDMPSKVVLRDDTGKMIMALEEMDMSQLMAAGWIMPEQFKVKAADGVTDIYGNMWKPADFDPKRKYPIIANVYPGPQTESVTANFNTITLNQRLAQLGFIVIQIGNRGGNPMRSNAYHSYGYFNLRDYGLADKKFGIEQLAARNPWIDIDRVGIYGHSGGGFMTAAALLLPPYNDFFKVGVSSAGNHDNNVYNANWSEQHHGLREVAATPPTTNRTAGGRTGRPEEPDFSEDWNNLEAVLASQQEPQATGTTATRFDIKVPTNHELAANLKGKLLLVHGDMDNNVHPAGTVRLVDALIKSNKRFDFMIMPGQAHGFGNMSNYFNQMLMEYFAEHLIGDYYRGSSDMTETRRQN